MLLFNRATRISKFWEICRYIAHSHSFHLNSTSGNVLFYFIDSCDDSKAQTSVSIDSNVQTADVNIKHTEIGWQGLGNKTKLCCQCVDVCRAMYTPQEQHAILPFYVKSTILSE